MRKTLLALSSAILFAGTAAAAELAIVSGAVGNDLDDLRVLLARFSEETGHAVDIVTMPSSSTDQFTQFKLWLSAHNGDIDIYQTDIIWAPQLAEHFVDLAPHAQDVVDSHFPAVIESQTVDGRLVALPLFADAPALYYRSDLLERHGERVPESWDELAESAARIMQAERAAGNERMWGFVFQGAAYEGLTCNALEWISSHGGGRIVEADGRVSVFNERAVLALDKAAGWVQTIAPPGVLSYAEEDARGVWQTGNAVFMRNWPYAYALGNSENSPVRERFGVVPLPRGEEGAGSAATLGGWNLAVSRYSREQGAAVELVKFLTSEEAQRYRALHSSRLPTLDALYDDAEIAQQQPIIPRWRSVLEHAIARPSAQTRVKYNEVSSLFWTAVHNSLSGQGSAADNLELLAAQLERLRGSQW